MTQLVAAIDDLKTIPDDVKVHPAVQNTLPTYQKQLKDLKTQLSKETKADETFKQAEALAQKASQATDNAETITALEDSKTQWQTVLNKLDSVPADSLLANQVKAKKTSYTQKVATIDDKIETLVATTRQQEWQGSPAVVESSRSPVRSVPPPVSRARQAPVAAPAPAYVPPPAAPAPAYVPPPAAAPAAPPAVGGAAEPPPSSQEPLWGPSTDQSTDEPLW